MPLQLFVLNLTEGEIKRHENMSPDNDMADNMHDYVIQRSPIKNPSKFNHLVKFENSHGLVGMHTYKNRTSSINIMHLQTTSYTYLTIHYMPLHCLL